MFILLELLRRALIRLGLVRAASDAERTLADADHAWRLIGDPALWTLWMPMVQDRIDAPRELRAGAHYRFSLRLEAARMWLGGATEGHVIVDEYEPGRVFAWRVTARQGEQRYSLRQAGTVTRCTVAGGSSAHGLLAELDRQSRS